MEPNTQPTTPMSATNKNKKMLIIIIIIIIIALGAFALSRSKSIAPSNTIGGNTDVTTTGTDSKQLTDEITSATTFDNEADLKEIDTAFQ